MKASPVSLTQEDVDAITSGGKAAARVRRRLRRTPSAKQAAPKGAGDDKMSPQPIGRKEMAAVQAGRMPADLRRRLASGSTADAGENLNTDKAVPSVAPRRRYGESTSRKR
jgi:hypothetical protein